MDGLFHGKPYEQMDDLGGKKPYFWFNTHISPQVSKVSMDGSTSTGPNPAPHGSTWFRFKFSSL